MSGTKDVFIQNNKIKNTSKIFITPTSITDKPLVVTEKLDGSGFKVSIISNTDSDISFDWMIINTYGEENSNNTGSQEENNQQGGQDTTSPIITINGDNPATITVGSSYADLGATVTDTDENGNVNNNLGITYTVNGTQMTEVSIDTSTTTSHTILYSAVDSAGNFGYATRTVEVINQ